MGICDRRTEDVERTMSLGVGGNGETSGVRETMWAQQELLQKINHERRRPLSRSSKEMEIASLEFQINLIRTSFRKISSSSAKPLVSTKAKFIEPIRWQGYSCLIVMLKAETSLSPREDLNPYWEQMRRIDDHVREILPRNLNGLCLGAE